MVNLSVDPRESGRPPTVTLRTDQRVGPPVRAEPWPKYGRLGVAEVRERLESALPAPRGPRPSCRSSAGRAPGRAPGRGKARTPHTPRRARRPDGRPHLRHERPGGRGPRAAPPTGGARADRPPERQVHAGTPGPPTAGRARPHRAEPRTAAQPPTTHSLSDACRAVGTLSRLMGAIVTPGARAALEVGPDELTLEREPGVVVAAVNGPRALVVSGDRDAVTAVHDDWADRSRRTRLLRVGPAAHSHHLDPVLDSYRATLRTMDLRAPRVPLISDVTARPIGAEAVEPEFWVRELRDPVRFSSALDLMRRDGVEAFLELGPGEVLARMIDEYPPDDGATGAPAVLTVARDWRALLGGGQPFPVLLTPDVG
ncbi:acyltransferase domain-containing protein [Streptomyces caniscabiei]|uniref:acyltransferase domain-containing protein n=1 Tax=Streptomyces caniscabiei TaxID=2746961 RepID=UPI000A3B07C3|nr:acyltransferase domain-containing protein [Streptomyces caniscabiei]